MEKASIKIEFTSKCKSVYKAVSIGDRHCDAERSEAEAMTISHEYNF